MTRTTPYTDLELEWLLDDANTREQQLDILKTHIDNDGKVKASMMLRATGCRNVDEVREMLADAQRRE